MGEEVWSAPASDWATLAGVVLVLMLLDFLVFSRMTSYSEASTIRDEQDEKAAGNADDAGPPQQLPEPEPESQERPRSQSHWANLFVLLCWIVCGLAFNALIFFTKGERKGVTWLCGYLLEWMLSFDNIFVFHLVFRTYKTPRELMHKALFFGILGAVIFRVVFFATLLSVMHVLHWVRFAFGVLLVYSGFQAAVEGDDDADPAESTAMRCFQGCLGSRVLGRYDVEGRRLFVTEDGKLLATMLVPVIFCLEVTDILFAVDSVSAKVAQIPDVYIAYSSSVLAMFGLRAMFFVIQDMVEAFDLLKYGLCFILVFIGIELLLADHVELPVHVVCVVICSVLLVCVAASALQRLWSHRRHHAEHSSAAN
jgi:tellurite resistance protein TerC